MIHSPLQLLLCAVALLVAAPASIGDTLLLFLSNRQSGLEFSFYRALGIRPHSFVLFRNRWQRVQAAVLCE